MAITIETGKHSVLDRMAHWAISLIGLNSSRTVDILRERGMETDDVTHKISTELKNAGNLRRTRAGNIVLEKPNGKSKIIYRSRS